MELQPYKPTSLSAGLVIREVLLDSPQVTAITGKVFPVVTDEARLPYVVYRRASLSRHPSNAGGADTIAVEVACFADGYAASLELAEAVRDALDYTSCTHDSGLRLRSCTLIDAEETYQADAFCQMLTFEIKI